MAPQPTLTPQPAATQRTAEAELAVWQQQYIQIVQDISATRGETAYDLVYLDADAIPELLIHYQTVAEGKEICTFFENEVRRTAIGYMGVLYLERENLFFQSGGRMGIYYDLVYTIRDGDVFILHEGEYETRWDDDGNATDFGHLWDGVMLSAAEYEQKDNEAFARLEEMREPGNLYTADEIIVEILACTS